MKGTKGMSLPIETIVIIAVAVLVLVVIVAFFISGAGQQFNAISDSDALTRGCTQLAMSRSGTGLTGCDVSLSDIQISGYKGKCGTLEGSTLQVACCRSGYTDYDYSSPNSCQVRACRCPPK